MARQFKGSRHGLDRLLAVRLNRYCEATDKQASKVIITALKRYLDAEENAAKKQEQKPA